MNYNFTFLSFEETMAGMLGTVTNAVMRPFTYSVTSQQTETLTISTAPALGSQAVAAPEPTQSPKMQLTKKTESTEITYPTPSPTTKKTTTTEEQSTQRTIYDLYADFADHYVKERPTRPSKDAVLPGTVIIVGGSLLLHR